MNAAPAGAPPRRRYLPKGSYSLKEKLFSPAAQIAMEPKVVAAGKKSPNPDK
jgi:hypothetical protein